MVRERIICDEMRMHGRGVPLGELGLGGVACWAGVAGGI